MNRGRNRDSLAAGVRKAGAISIVALMACVMFVGLTVSAPGAGASTTAEFYGTADQYGFGGTMLYKRSSGATDTWPPVTVYLGGATSVVKVGTDHLYTGSYVHQIFRPALFFDTSSIPSGVVVTSATLKMRGVSDTSALDFQVLVYQASYGATYTAADWGSYGSLEGVFTDTSMFSYSYRSMPVSPSFVNAAGWTQYMLMSGSEAADPGTNSYVSFGSEALGTSYCTVLEVEYRYPGTDVSIELDGGAWLNGTAFPDIQDWNLTYELHCYEIDTVPSSKNVTIAKGDANWTMCGISPMCNNTETDDELLLWDVYDSVCYRVWFYVPKSNPYSTVHLSLYNSFTGEGFFWEQMKVMICDGGAWDNESAEQLSRPDFDVEPNSEYTLRVLDYFDNDLVDYPFVSSSPSIYLSIPVPVYSWQIFNMNEEPVLVKVFWNNSGSPMEFFTGPSWIVERFLKGGNYTFGVTFYGTDGVVGDTVYFNRTIPMAGLNASFVYVNGTSLFEIVTAVEGLQSTQLILTYMLSPSLVWIGEMVPQIPSSILSVSSDSYVKTYYMLNVRTVEYGNGTDISYESNVGDAALDPSYSSDSLYMSGNYTTEVWVNDTAAGTTLGHYAVVPPVVELAGSDYSVEANGTLSTVRDATYRWYEPLTYAYSPTYESYSVEATIANDQGVDWQNATLFLPFMNNTAVNNRSVRVWDMNNSAYLTEGVHWVQTAQGVYMWFLRWNDTVCRGFVLSYNSVDEEFLSPAHVEVATVGDGSSVTTAWQGDTFYFANARWVNDRREAYTGVLYIDLTFSMSVDASTVVVLRVDSMTVVTGVVVVGKTIIIDSVSVPVDGAAEYVILFKNERSSGILSAEFLGIPVVVLALLVAFASFIPGLIFVQIKKSKRMEQLGKTLLGIAVLSVMVVAVMFIYFIGVSGG